MHQMVILMKRNECFHYLLRIVLLVTNKEKEGKAFTGVHATNTAPLVMLIPKIHSYLL